MRKYGIKMVFKETGSLVGGYRSLGVIIFHQNTGTNPTEHIMPFRMWTCMVLAPKLEIV
jgi:hypothetical protein